MTKRKPFFLGIAIFLMLFSLNILAQPTITQQPQPQTVNEGETATFTITATSVDTLIYQWYKNGVEISGATSSSYTTPSTTTADNGAVFYCMVSDSTASVESDNVTLTVIAGQAPTITSQPTDQQVTLGAQATFSVTASGTDPLQYQWYKNGVSIAGATNSTYTTQATVELDNYSTYYCEITNSFGSVTSNSATLTVLPTSGRITSGLQVLYNFKEGSGTTINDVSGVGDAIDLEIDDLNLVSWTGEGLNIHGDARIRSSNVATKLIDSCKTSNEITFEAWVLPSTDFTRNQHARLFTVSKDFYQSRNFGVIQNNDQHYFLLRTTTTSDNGEVFGYDTALVELEHLVFTRASDGTVNTYRNGNLVSSTTISGDFSNWADDFRIYLGNDTNGPLYWEGTYYLTAVYNKALNSAEVKYNYDQGVNTDQKPYFTVNPIDQYVIENDVVSFSAFAVSVNPVTYQWRKNGADIPGETGPTLTIQATSEYVDAEITCVATSSGGTTVSAPAKLNVTLLNNRVTAGQKVLYTFREGSGNIINDVSNAGTPINMNIFDEDAVEWTEYGLKINQAATIITPSPATRLSEAAKNSNALTIEAWIIPNDTVQTGPASILNLAEGASARDFSLAQTADSFNVRVRTTSTDLNGEPSTSSAAGTVSANEFNHVVFTRSADGVNKLYIDGTERVSKNVSGDFSNWESFILALGNEVGGGAPWLGTVNLIAVFDRALSQTEVLKNFNFGAYGYIEAPTNLAISSNEIRMVTISWNDNSTNEDGFIIERGEGSPAVFTVLDTLSADTTSFTDTSVVDNKDYTYRVSAFNSIGKSKYSNEIVVHTLISPLLAPSNLQYSLLSDGYPELTWEDNSDNEDGFVIERRDAVAGAEYSAVDTVEANINSYTDRSVSDSTSYVYRVFAFNADTTSGYSGEKIVDVLTDVEDNIIPLEYSLSQNYPNPFNPSTTIKFGLPEAANVKIVLYNILGQQVRTLVSKDLAAGNHSVNFNAENLTSGLYIYSIAAKGVNGKNFVATKKMVLLK